MIQLQLGLPPEALARKAEPPKWERLSEPGDKCAAHWRHPSGWEVRHCGHPTANYPYFAVTPEGVSPIVADNGRGFMRLGLAFAKIERLIGGGE